MIHHFCSAVGTEHKPRQGIGLAQCVMPPWRFPQLLRKLPCFPIHNGLVGILEDQPILRGIHHRILVLIGLLVGTEIHSMPHILRLGENLPNDVAAPVIRVGELLLAFPDTLVLFAKVDRRRVDLVIEQDAGDVVGAFALNGQLEDTPHHGSRFLVDQPVGFVLRVFLIAVDGTVGGWLAGFPLDPNGGFLLAAQVTKIPFVHDVEEGRKLVAVLVITVHAVGNGNKVDAMLPEEYLCVKAGLQIVTPRPAHILDNDMGHLACFNVRHQLFPCRTLEIAAAPSILGIVAAVGVASLLGIAFEVFFLIHDGVAITGIVIVTA